MFGMPMIMLDQLNQEAMLIEELTQSVLFNLIMN